MRYKKGTNVEVLDKRDVPSGCWRSAVILSGNGHTYCVRYDTCPSGMDELVERVSRKVIRPCPPSLQDSTGWMSGDVAEVFNDGSWKLAEVSSADKGDCFFVRLLGSSSLFKAQNSDLRLRQCWQDNGWVVMRKDVKKSDKLLKSGYFWRVSCQQTRTSGFIVAEDCEETTTNEEHRRVTFGRKRLLEDSLLPFEMCYGRTKNQKAGELESVHQHLGVDSRHRSQEKVDAVASPKMMLGETYMHAPLNYMTGYSQLDLETGTSNGFVGCVLTSHLEPSDVSVCSSSGSNDLDMLCDSPFTTTITDRGNFSDDASSSCCFKTQGTMVLSSGNILPIRCRR